MNLLESRFGRREEKCSGFCFSIPSFDRIGVEEFGAVSSPPKVAILGVGAGKQRPVVIDGELGVAPVMSVPLSCDHRAVDGAIGAEWLQTFKGFIENPVTMPL